MHQHNSPKWDKSSSGFYEVWYLKLNLAPEGGTSDAGPALWIRFTTLSLKTGLKKIAETWAVFFDPNESAEKRKIAIKNSSTLGAYEVSTDGTIRIEDCELGAGYSSGCVVSRGNRIEWDLKFDQNKTTFFHVPEVLQRLKLTQTRTCDPNINVFFSGTFTVNGKVYTCDLAPGSQGHIWGTRYPYKWAWAHCNMFEGNPVAVVEMISARMKIGGMIPSPQLSTLFLEYKGDRYEFNHIKDALTIKSDYSLTQWSFAADKGPLRIAGEVQCDVKDLLALTYEDTDGSFLYCNNSELGSMNLSIYFKGKLDTTLKSKRAAGFETVSRDRSPYVEILI